MNEVNEQAVIDFYRYPPLGAEDWRYAFATARVRVLESMMLTHGVLVDIANAATFEEAMELLNGSDYAMSGVASFDEVESMLLARRSEARHLFVELIEDEATVELLCAREDFANMRLAVRRVVTERAIGGDYSDEGSVGAEEFEEIFEQENYSRFPEYLQEAVEKAVLGYYESKDIREIDYNIDRFQAQYKLKKARELGSVFLESLFRIQIDLTNIRTMLRLKLAEREEKNLFLPAGFVGIDRLVHALDIGYEALAPLFFSTPYHDVVEGGVSYLTGENSFLVLEKLCEGYLAGFLRSALMVSSGVQPVIAYFLLKEIEIRTVRMLLSGKRNGLEAKMLHDRLCEA